jgi:hypothetical protein
VDVPHGLQQVAIVRVDLLEAMLVGAGQVQRVIRSDDDRARGSRDNSNDQTVVKVLAPDRDNSWYRPDMNRKVGGRVILLIVTTLFAAEAAGQETPHGSLYVTGGITAPFVSDDGDPPGGWSRGWTVGLGKFLKKDVVSVEVELSQTGVLTHIGVIAQETGGIAEERLVYDSRRDRLIGANFRFHLDNRDNRPGHFEPLIGVGLFQYQCWTQPSRYISAPGVFPWEVEPTGTRSACKGFGLYIGGGLEVRLGGPRFAVLPSARAYLLTKPTHAEDRYRLKGGWLYFSPWTFTPGVKAIVSF